MGKIVLITGGARSGKSRFAEQYAAKCGNRVAYLATAEVHDKEMEFRVKLHQKRRPISWKTWEAPWDAHRALEEARRESYDIVLFDCLTLYISNILCSMNDISDSSKNYDIVHEKIELLLEQARKSKGTVIFVTNEVGAGIVPDNMLAREYRDIVGLMNQIVGQAASEVYQVTCGISVDLKKFGESVLSSSCFPKT